MLAAHSQGVRHRPRAWQPTSGPHSCDGHWKASAPVLVQALPGYTHYDEVSQIYWPAAWHAYMTQSCIQLNNAEACGAESFAAMSCAWSCIAQASNCLLVANCLPRLLTETPDVNALVHSGIIHFPCQGCLGSCNTVSTRAFSYASNSSS